MRLRSSTPRIVIGENSSISLIPVSSLADIIVPARRREVSSCYYLAAPSALASVFTSALAFDLEAGDFAAAFGALSLRTAPHGSVVPFCSGILPSDLW